MNLLKLICLFGFNHMPVNWHSRQDWFPKPCNVDAPNETVRCRELQSHLQQGTEIGAPGRILTCNRDVRSVAL